ncbi:MAG TPA: hypothetical protein VF635_12820 [Propionibacteriaceae bacterium]|jgi:hypothetical protein
MTPDPLPALKAGILGRFWTLDKDPTPSGQLQEKDARAGQLQVVAGMVRVKTQSAGTHTLEDWHEAFTTMAEGGAPAPRWIAGITELGTVVVPVVSTEAMHESLGGNRVSTRTFRSPAVAVGVEQPYGPRLTRLAVRLPYAAWADLDPMSTVGHFDDQNRWTGLDIQLRGTEQVACGRVGSIALSLRGTWNRHDDEQEHRTWIGTGLEVITESKTPRDHDEHVEVIMGVQDLVSLAYDRFLPATRAGVVLEGDDSGRSSTWFYHRELVEASGLTEEPSTDEQKRPLFKLSDLGGPSAVSRWVTLNRQYPDAANAIRVRYRTPTNPTRRIIELGAAIEQYVRTNVAEARTRGRTTPGWTRPEPWEAALAQHAGAGFANLVGDPLRWGRLFNAAYVSEKHYTGARYPAAELLRLSSSAQLLLISILLNRAAGSHKPSQVILADHRVNQLGEVIRPLVASWKPTKGRRA